MGGGDAEVDAIRTVIEGRRHNRGRRGRNGRVNAEVDAVKLPEHRGAAGFARSSIGDESTRRCCRYQAYKKEGPNRVVVLGEEEAMREKTRR